LKFIIRNGSLRPADRSALEYVAQREFAVDVELEDVARKRSKPQNSSLHLWLSQVAVILNNAGIDMVLFLEQLNGKAEIPVTQKSLKERFWKPIMEHMTGKQSTTEMDTKDPDILYQTACRILAENFEIVPPPWPSHEREDLRDV
jgi:hypothetical protein